VSVVPGSISLRDATRLLVRIDWATRGRGAAQRVPFVADAGPAPAEAPGSAWCLAGRERRAGVWRREPRRAGRGRCS